MAISHAVTRTFNHADVEDRPEELIGLYTHFDGAVRKVHDIEREWPGYFIITFTDKTKMVFSHFAVRKFSTVKSACPSEYIRTEVPKPKTPWWKSVLAGNK